MQIIDVKEEAHHLLEKLPENATWDDLMYKIYVRQAIEALYPTGRGLSPRASIFASKRTLSVRERRFNIFRTAGTISTA